MKRVLTAEVSAGVNSKELLLIFKLFNKNVYFVILSSLFAIISKSFSASQDILKVIKIFITRTFVYMK